MVIDPSALRGSPLGAGTGTAFDASDLTYLPVDFPRKLYWETAQRFKESRDRILFARAVRNEEIVVPIPDSLISDEDANFIGYIAPERRRIEADARQTLANNMPVMRRPKVGDSDRADRDVEAVTALAEAVKAELVDWDAIVGKDVEDGEWAVSIEYDLDYLFERPMPSEIISEDDWAKLPEAERADWHRCELSRGRVTYRRYRRRYWRDAEGRRPSDRYYQTVDPAIGGKPAFERNDLATRRAWREHMKALGEGVLPLRARLIPALDCAPLLIRGTRGGRRWETRGLAVRLRCTQSNLVAQGLRWDDMPGLLLERGYDADESTRFVDIYEAHVYLADPEAEDDEPYMQPCVVYQIDGKATWRENPRTGQREPAVVNLWDEYGLDFLPVEYFHGCHSDDDEPGNYAYPLIHPLLSAILNHEGNRTAFQGHLRKHSFSKLATTPSKDVLPQTYLNSDGSIREIDLDADIIMLPGPLAPMIGPPESQAAKDLDTMYMHTLAANAPGAPEGDGQTSGHALVVAQSQYLSKNVHVREGARRCVEWIVSTACRMLAALDEKHGTKVSVFPAGDVPTDTTAAKPTRNVITFDPRIFRGNFRLKAVYPDVGNLAEIQQEADLKERGLSTFRRVMEKKGVVDVFSERVEVMADKWWESEEGQKYTFLEVLKRRGDMERAAVLEAQLNKEITPGGLPMNALPPQMQALAQGGPMGPAGGPGGLPVGAPPGAPPGARPMPGMQMPNLAGSALGGITAGALGTASLQRDAMAQATMPPPPSGPGPGMGV